jgi:hypothetical protein
LRDKSLQVIINMQFLTVCKLNMRFPPEPPAIKVELKGGGPRTAKMIASKMYVFLCFVGNIDEGG